MPTRPCRRDSAQSSLAVGTIAAVIESKGDSHMSIFNRILCPIDFDGNSLDALRLARRIAEQDKATLYLLHVIPPQDPLVMSAPAIAEHDEKYARAELQRVSNAELTGVDHEVLLRFGHPAEQIVAAERETKAELLVMATHGRTGVSHFIMGSVAERVVRESACPVLTVRMSTNHQPSKSN
jgi:universal stress protein A